MPTAKADQLTQLARSTRRSIVAASLIAAGCHFTYDRHLSAGQLIGTVVIDGSNGKPVAVPGARVALELSTVAITTDSQGQFAFNGLQPGTYAIDVTSSTTGTGAVDTVLRVANIVLAAESGGKADGRDLGQLTIGAFGGVGGTIVNGSTPVFGAVVAIPEFATYQSLNGAFSFANLLPGDYSLSVFVALSTGGGLLSAPVAFTVQPRLVSQLNVNMANGTMVTTGGMRGEAQLHGGSSNAGVAVGLAGLNLPVTTDATGSYSQPSIPAGIYTLVASDTGYLTVNVLGVVIGGPTTQVPMITLGPGTTSSSGPDAGGSPADIQQGAATATSPGYRGITVAGDSPPAQQSTGYRFTPLPLAARPIGTGVSP